MTHGLTTTTTSDAALVKVAMQLRRGDSHSHDTFFVYAHQKLLEDWKNDRSIPLVDVVGSFTVYETESGRAITASHHRLKDYFGTEDTDTIITQILQKGRPHPVTSDKNHMKHPDSTVH